jgi:hypothetical protein
MANIISFSLYGDLPIYCEGALSNIDLAKIHYPGWVCRFYVDDTVPNLVLDKIAATGAELIHVTTPSLGPMYGRFWRFWVADDPDVDRFVVRDVDSRLNPREKAAVDAWIASGRRFHLMRDSPWHTKRVLSGMWGGLGGSLPEIATLIDEWGQYAEWGQNDLFASEILYPLMQGDYLCHDEGTIFDDGVPFPSHAPLNGTSFVGESVQPGSENLDIWRQYGILLKDYHGELARVGEILKRETKRADSAEARLVSEIERALTVENQLRHELAEHELERQSMLSSTSWRITGPLRRVKQIFSQWR